MKRKSDLIDKVVYPELSYRMVGVLFRVSNELGYGLREVDYKNAITQLLLGEKINFLREVAVKITFKSGDTAVKLTADFVVENKIILEIKTKERFAKTDIEQLKSYLKATKYKLGILATFTRRGIKFYRVLNCY